MGVRCASCGVCHYDDDVSNKNGGVGQMFDWDPERQPYCPVCEDRRKEWEAKALPHRLEQYYKPDTEQTTL